MPTSSGPEIFGLHSNAEISYFVDNAKSIWHGLLKISIASSSGSKNEPVAGSPKEDTLAGTILEILEKLPKRGLYFCADTGAPTPTQVVLAQVSLSALVYFKNLRLASTSRTNRQTCVPMNLIRVTRRKATFLSVCRSLIV